MALLDEWQAPEPSPYFATRLRARVREEALAPRREWLSWLRRPVLAAAAAVLIAMGVGLLEVEPFHHTDHGSSWPETWPRVAKTSSAVSDLQYLDKNADLFAEFDALDGQSFNGVSRKVVRLAKIISLTAVLLLSARRRLSALFRWQHRGGAAVSPSPPRCTTAHRAERSASQQFRFFDSVCQIPTVSAEGAWTASRRLAAQVHGAAARRAGAATAGRSQFRSLSPDRQKHCWIVCANSTASLRRRRRKILNRMETYEHMTPSSSSRRTDLFRALSQPAGRSEEQGLAGLSPAARHASAAAQPGDC